MNTHEQILSCSTELKIPGFRKYQANVKTAEEKKQSYADFLLGLLSTEVENRKTNQQKRLIKQAGFPFLKSLDEYIFENIPGLNENQIWALSTGEFVRNCENIVMIGPPGTGKTHLAIGLGARLCALGYKVVFYTAANLVNRMSEAQEARQLLKLKRQLLKSDLLILDEMSYLSFKPEESQLLFQAISERSERGSILITTNSKFSKWSDYFGDKMLTAALVDRLTYRSNIVDMNGPSHRLRTSRGSDAK